jgi:hypothetical protein
MNFSVVLREPTADVKWRGNVRELQRNGADFGVAHHFLTLGTVKHYDDVLINHILS